MRKRLVLVNAICFKGGLSEPSPKAANRIGDFAVPGAPAFMVPMMNAVLGASRRGSVIG